MASKSSPMPWLLLAGVGAVAYLIYKNQPAETPRAYPYPVGSTSATLSPSASVPMTPSVPAPAPTPPRPRRRPGEIPRIPPVPAPSPTPSPTPTPSPDRRDGSPYPHGRPRPQSPPHIIALKPIQMQTVTAREVLGRPAQPVYPVYDLAGQVIGTRVLTGGPPVILKS